MRPDWHSDDDNKGAIKIVMTGCSVRSRRLAAAYRQQAAARSTWPNERADADDPLKLVIVRDMWLTGFDAPCMNTMYVDKPMQGHGLMQAIARVNRVFSDKPGGLIVDYIGIAQNLKNALKDYSPNDQEKTGIPEEDAVAAMLEAYERVCGVFYGFDYATGHSRNANGTIGNPCRCCRLGLEMAGNRSCEDQRR